MKITSLMHCAVRKRACADWEIVYSAHLSCTDFTAGAIIDGFQNESMAKAVDRVMKQLAQEKAQTIMKNREPRLPSPTFIKAYMDSFRTRELMRGLRWTDLRVAEHAIFR